MESLDTTIQCFIAMPRMHLTHHYKLIMKMFYTGTDPIDVHPSKVDEMKRKGWSIKPPQEAKPSSSNKKGE